LLECCGISEFYYYVVETWFEGDPAQLSPDQSQRRNQRLKWTPTYMLMMFCRYCRISGGIPGLLLGFSVSGNHGTALIDLIP
jgi:hypothetical protein